MCSCNTLYKILVKREKNLIIFFVELTMNVGLLGWNMLEN